MRLRIIFVFAFVSYLCKDVMAQESILDKIDYVYMEKLIELAKENYPNSKIQKIQESRSRAAVRAAKVSYLDIINISYFYRPEDRAALNPNNPFLFNGFQLGLSLSPGLFFQKPFEVKQAKSEYQIAQLETKNMEVALETVVKSSYYDYILTLNEVRTTTEEVQTARTLVDDLRVKFEKGEAELDRYTSARATLAANTTSLIRAEVNYLKRKDALEELIGMRLDEVKK